jgi:hypothetical protein
LDPLLSSLLKQKFGSSYKGNEALWIKAEIQREDIQQIRAYTKQRQELKDEARKYIIGSGPIKVKDTKVAIQENESRKKGKGSKRKQGKCKCKE